MTQQPQPQQLQPQRLSPLREFQLQPQQPYAATQSNLSPPMLQGYLNYTQQQTMQQQQSQSQIQPQQATLSVSSSAGSSSALPPMHPAAHTLYNLGSSHFGVSVSGGTQLVQTLSSAAGPPSPEERREAAELGRRWMQDPASGQWSLWASSPSSSFSSQPAMQMHDSSPQRSFGQLAQRSVESQPLLQQLDPRALPYSPLSNPIYSTHSISQLQGGQDQEATDQLFMRDQPLSMSSYPAQLPPQQSIYNQELSSFHSQEQMQFDRGFQHSTPAQQLAPGFAQTQQQQLYQRSFSNPPQQQTFSQSGFGSRGHGGDHEPLSIDASVPQASPASSYSSAFGRRNPLIRASSFGNGTRSQMASAMRQTFPMHGSSSQHAGSLSSHPPLPWQQPAPIAAPSGQGTVLVLTLIHPKYSDEPHRAHLIQLMRPKLINGHGHGHDELKQFDHGHIDEHSIIEVPVPSVDEVATLFRKHGRLLKIIVSFKAGLSRSLVQVSQDEHPTTARIGSSQSDSHLSLPACVACPSVRVRCQRDLCAQRLRRPRVPQRDHRSQLRAHASRTEQFHVRSTTAHARCMRRNQPPLTRLVLSSCGPQLADCGRVSEVPRSSSRLHSRRGQRQWRHERRRRRRRFLVWRHARHERRRYDDRCFGARTCIANRWIASGQTKQATATSILCLISNSRPSLLGVSVCAARQRDLPQRPVLHLRPDSKDQGK